MRDVIGYEEKWAGTLRSIPQGYPRFVNHYMVKQLEQALCERLLYCKDSRRKDSCRKDSRRRKLRLLPSRRAFKLLQDYLDCEMGCGVGCGVDIELHVEKSSGRRSLYCVSFPDEEPLKESIGNFLQCSGLMVFSREAEDHLAGKRHEESYFAGEGAQEQIKAVLARYHETAAQNVWLCRSGMSAFFAAFLALQELQAQKGRHLWIQLGWLYCDTIQLLRKFGSQHNYIYLDDVTDLSSLEQVFRQRGALVAGVVCEFPNNPLLRSPPLKQLSQLCRRHGAALILDPTIASAYNLPLLSQVDVAVLSLSKYYGYLGDVIMGAVMLNPNSPFYSQLTDRLPAYLESPYFRDINRLAFEIERYPLLMEKINHNARLLAHFLEEHPAVKRLYWPYSADVRANYELYASGPGGVMSIELKGSLGRFYDRVNLAKGPSFGFPFTLLCPFIYLAHYDLLRSAEGRSCLRQNGINPQLLRISVGCEPIESLLTAFAEAL